MTVVVPGVGVISKKQRWKQLLIPLEIPAARFSCLTSGSFRPKLGLCILLIILTGCICLILPLFASNYGAFSVFSSSHESSAQHKKKIEITNMEAVRSVATSNNAFNLKLYEQLVNNNNNNMVMSSFSVQSVISMVLTGAKGETAKQIRSGLSLPHDEHLLPGYKNILNALNDNGDGNFTLRSANRLYTQEGFKILEKFLETNKKNYLAEPEAVNFRDEENARGKINNWVEGQTKNKIKELIPSGIIKPNTMLVLVNAIYFKGDWDNKFETKSTFKQDFHTSSGRTLKVDMMHKTAKYALCSPKELNAQAIEMPYKGKRMSMIFVLPNSKDGLAKLEKDLTTFDTKTGFEFRREVELQVAIPKFKVESKHDLNEPLQNLGLKHMFDAEAADFSGITGGRDLFVSKVLQKAFIEVNEEGAEAAAATGAIMMLRSMPMTKPTFICDHPFLFMIKDNLTGLILFSGRIINPAE